MYHAEWCHLPVQYLRKDVKREHQLSNTGYCWAILAFLGFVVVGTVITVACVEAQFWRPRKSAKDPSDSRTPPSPDTCPAGARNRLILEELGRWARYTNILFEYVVNLVVRPLFA